MVEAAEIRMRLHEFAALGGLVAPHCNIPGSIIAMRPKELHITIEGRPADAAGFSEIDPVAGHQLEDPAAAVELISSSANDNQSATGHVQSLYCIGINGDDEIVTNLEVMHATVGTTMQLTTNVYKELFHSYAAAHGSGDMDAAGNITVRDIADNAITVITAGNNESDGSAFKVPDGHCAMLTHAHIKRLEPAAGVYAADEGVRFRIVYIDAIDGETGMVAADRHLNYLTMEAVGGYIHEAHCSGGEIFEAGTWIHFQHSSKVDAGELYSAHLRFLIWKK